MTCAIPDDDGMHDGAISSKAETPTDDDRPRRSSVVGEHDWTQRCAATILRRLAARGFAGADPYDGLSAARIPDRLLRRPLARRVLTQVVKRSPLPLQRPLGIPAGVDMYTCGHALLAAARLEPPALDERQRRDLCARLFAALRSGTLAAAPNEALGASGRAGWGYHFPVHTRFFTYGPGTPNVIVTAFVVKGLSAMTRAGLGDARAEIAGAVRFVLEGLPRRVDESGQCFGYLPGESAVVHNANLLAALVLCEAAELCSVDSWLDEAVAAARFTVARQAPDGSWPYSEEARGRWVDGFHTGFVLEGLARVLRARPDADVQASLERGLTYYVAQLFGPRGEPKYHPERPLPFDALSAAQGVETLQVAFPRAATAVPCQLDWIRFNLVRPDGRVAYQVHRGWTDWREFPRWASAPLASALAGVMQGGRVSDPPAAGVTPWRLAG